MRKISFVIPCYNSEKTIEDVVKEIEVTIEKRGKDDYEIVLVNDCSKDNVWEKIKSISKQNAKVTGVCFAKNFGQHAALMAGYRKATGDIVVSLDDDGQTPADEVYSLIDKMEEGYDVVYASYPHKKHSFARNLGTKMNNFMCEVLLGKPKKLMITSFFVAKKYIVDEIVKYENSYTYVPGLVLRTTKSIGSVPVCHREREVGNSGYSFAKLVALWINGFTAFSVAPLRISMVMGMSSAAIGFIYLIYVIVNKFFNPSVPLGWSSTTAILLLLGGMILFVLGMIGEYLGRVYISLNSAPQYVVREETDDKEK
ncbi:MAG: glycosyltransferase family 2 protein [Lachnospiraceae bacterium]|nr:glycosyltransferase family 2 protein [Lachnospiraceae bacterium]